MQFIVNVDNFVDARVSAGPVGFLSRKQFGLCLVDTTGSPSSLHSGSSSSDHWRGPPQGSGDEGAHAIVRAYGAFIDCAKEKAKVVTVSSILPKLASNCKTEAVNAGLLATCNEKGASFANSDCYLEPSGNTLMAV